MIRVMNARAFAVVWTCAATVWMSGGSARLDGASTTRVEVRRVPNGGIQPQVMVDTRGVLHMLYFAGEPRAGNLFYVRSTDFGTTFSPPIRVNSREGSAIAAGTIRGGQLALGRAGRVHVAWNGSDAAMPRGVTNPRTGRASAPFLYTSSSGDGTAFLPERNLMQASYDLDGGGSIAADAAGRVYGVWHANGVTGPPGEANRRVWVARSTDDGATFGTEQPAQRDHTGACGCCGLSAFATRANGLAVLYRSVAEMTNRDIYLLLSGDRGRPFRGSRVHEWNIGACPMSSMSLAETTRGVLGAWETAGQVYFGALDSVSASIAKPISPQGDAGNRKHPRLAAGANGHTLLVWTEGTAWARGGSLAWQAFDAEGRPAGPTESAAGVPAWSFGAAAAMKSGEFVVFY
jgi:hypothetical protein